MVMNGEEGGEEGDRVAIPVFSISSILTPCWVQMEGIRKGLYNKPYKRVNSDKGRILTDQVLHPCFLHR